MNECSQIRINLGVYMLGAIDPAERAVVDAHLATCRDCRDELAGLAGIPALLSRISVEDAAQAPDDPVPEDLADRAVELAAARRRRRALRSGLLTAAAAVVIAVAAFGGAHLLISPASRAVATGVSDPHSYGVAMGSWENVKGSNKSGEAIWVSYRSMGWGLQLDTRVVGIPVGTTCQLYVVTRDGQRHLAGQWMTDTYESDVWYPGSAAVPESQVTSFEVTTGRTPPVVITAH
jgi:hypothetical protein